MRFDQSHTEGAPPLPACGERVGVIGARLGMSIADPVVLCAGVVAHRGDDGFCRRRCKESAMGVAHEWRHESWPRLFS